ncbi:hypothetical protein GPECTOR_7g1179 [Gonium pectorale]|uniref:Rab3-GAP regulatory subunit N-terminal domain-containing protein n=1 Tax=Gonium pectorale TaxID=33097 RepID=A0A150GTU6_GONPE|nr:hypothetical protein GPECTOR_7g1179 [Gonium pectorale]|eukprot:KXZ53285.1 hypothetical protein GPECTOR_7g1179 [Gonium pectorale]
MMLEDHEDSRQLQRQQQRRQPQGQGQGEVAPRGPHQGYSLVVLLAGTRGGALQLHDADSGALLLRQQMHSGPVLSITVRTWRMGLKPDDAVEDVTVGWADAVARIAAWELRTAATSCYAAAAARLRADGGASQFRFGLWGSSASAGPDIKPVAAQKWEVPASLRGRTCTVCCGQRPRDLYSLLQKGVSTSGVASGKTIFLAGGDRPACLAALEVDEQGPGGGALSYISSVATSVSSGVLGLARTARSVAAAPLALTGGLRYLMNPLQLAAGGGGGAQGDPQHQQPGQQQPLASFADAAAGQRAPSSGLWRQHCDEGRAVLALAPAPHGSLVAAVDSLGRVLLVEAGAMLVSRMWKRGGGGELGTWRVADAASAAVPPMVPAGCALCSWEVRVREEEEERGGGWESEAWAQWPDAAKAHSAREERELVVRDCLDIFELS